MLRPWGHLAWWATCGMVGQVRRGGPRAAWSVSVVIHCVQMLSPPGAVPWWGRPAWTARLLFYAAASPLLAVQPMWREMSGGDRQYLVLLMPLNVTEHTHWTPHRVMKTLEGPLHCKIKPVNPEGNQAWIFVGRTDAEVELQHFGRLMRRADSLEKTLMLERLKAKGEADGREGDG